MFYHSHDARIASFPKRATKSRPGWPHAAIKVSTLASAGFYYSGTNESPDSVTCFLCRKSLDGWDGDEDPLVEHENHTEKVGGCAWVTLMKGKNMKGKKSRDEIWLPRGHTLELCREKTYAGFWEHERYLSAKVMAKSGFHFTPLEKGDDTSTCMFCEVSLNGWEKGDNPLEEHQRRYPNCYFFVSPSPKLPSKSSNAIDFPKSTTTDSITAPILPKSTRTRKNATATEDEGETDSLEIVPTKSRRVTRGKSKGLLTSPISDPYVDTDEHKVIVQESKRQTRANSIAANLVPPLPTTAKKISRKIKEVVDDADGDVDEPPPPPSKKKSGKSKRSIAVLPQHESESETPVLKQICSPPPKSKLRSQMTKEAPATYEEMEVATKDYDGDEDEQERPRSRASSIGSKSRRSSKRSGSVTEYETDLEPGGQKYRKSSSGRKSTSKSQSATRKDRGPEQSDDNEEAPKPRSRKSSVTSKRMRQSSASSARRKAVVDEEEPTEGVAVKRSSKKSKASIQTNEERQETPVLANQVNENQNKRRPTTAKLKSVQVPPSVSSTGEFDEWPQRRTRSTRAKESELESDVSIKSHATKSKSKAKGKAKAVILTHEEETEESPRPPTKKGQYKAVETLGEEGSTGMTRSSRSRPVPATDDSMDIIEQPKQAKRKVKKSVAATPSEAEKLQRRTRASTRNVLASSVMSSTGEAEEGMRRSTRNMAKVSDKETSDVSVAPPPPKGRGKKSSNVLAQSTRVLRNGRSVSANNDTDTDMVMDSERDKISASDNLMQIDEEMLSEEDDSASSSQENSDVAKILLKKRKSSKAYNKRSIVAHAKQTITESLPQPSSPTTLTKSMKTKDMMKLQAPITPIRAAAPAAIVEHSTIKKSMKIFDMPPPTPHFGPEKPMMTLPKNLLPFKVKLGASQLSTDQEGLVDFPPPGEDEMEMSAMDWYIKCVHENLKQQEEIVNAFREETIREWMRRRKELEEISVRD